MLHAYAAEQVVGSGRRGRLGIVVAAPLAPALALALHPSKRAVKRLVATSGAGVMAGTEVKVPEEHDGEGDETQDEEENGLPDYVELGFPSARGAPAALTPFVSRVGGRPSWLVPDALPSIEAELLCANCSMPMTLLVHLYAPDERFERSYHRVVQVYCCRIGKCHAKPAEQWFAQSSRTYLCHAHPSCAQTAFAFCGSSCQSRVPFMRTQRPTPPHIGKAVCVSHMVDRSFDPRH